MHKQITIASLALILFASVATGQDTSSDERRTRITPQLALALLTVSEEGWLDCDESDCNDAPMRAVHAVIANGAERQGLRYVTYAASYARGLIGRQRLIQRPWLWGLRPDGRQPDAWPTEVSVRGRVVRHAPWSAYRERWLRTYERAGAVVQLSLEDWRTWVPCDRIPDDWGGSMDRARAERLGLVEVACEGTRNSFYVRPSTLAAEADEEPLGG